MYVSTFWIRDVVSAAALANVDASGRTDYTGASHSVRVRPVYKLF